MKRVPPPPSNRKAPPPPRHLPTRTLPTRPPPTEQLSPPVSREVEQEQERPEVIRREMEKQEEEVPPVQIEMAENLNEDIEQSDTEAIEPQEVTKRAQTTQSPPQVQAPKRGNLPVKSGPPSGMRSKAPPPKPKIERPLPPAIVTPGKARESEAITVQKVEESVEEHLPESQINEVEQTPKEEIVPPVRITPAKVKEAQRDGKVPVPTVKSKPPVVQTPTKPSQVPPQAEPVASSQSNSKLMQKLLKLQKAKEEMEENVYNEEEYSQQNNESSEYEDEEEEDEGEGEGEGDKQQNGDKFMAVEEERENEEKISEQKAEAKDKIQEDLLEVQEEVAEQIIETVRAPSPKQKHVPAPPRSKKVPTPPVKAIPVKSPPKQVETVVKTPQQPLPQSKQQTPEQKIEITLPTQPEKSTLSEINLLLARYQSLKKTYVSNIQTLEQQVSSHRQQEKTEFDKINHLMAVLSSKNDSIRQLCSLRVPQVPLSPFPQEFTI